MSHPTNLEELLSLENESLKIKYHFFWGHTPKNPDTVDASCLSNWYPSNFELNGDTYLTNEHYMMAAKANLFGDQEILKKILSCQHPGEAKKLGREVSNFNEEVWLEKRFQIVVRGCFEKFNQNESLKNYLLKTGHKVLVEASPVDRIWGIGMGKNNPDAEKPSRWKGLNLLGFALMKARSQLR